MPMPFGPGVIAVGCSHAIPTSPPRPDRSWISYAGRWRGKPLDARDCVLSADEKTSIQARRRVHRSLPPQPHRAARVEHEYERMGAWAYLAAWDVQPSTLGRMTQGCSPKVDRSDFPRVPRASADAHEAALLHLSPMVCAGPPRRPSPARVFGPGVSAGAPRADASLVAPS
jgi:hypothetical protein